MMRFTSRSALPILAATALAAARRPPPLSSRPLRRPRRRWAPRDSDTIPASVRWFRASAERRALSLQTYRLATAALERRAAGLPAGSWAVILDADETVIDNSPDQQELARRRATFDAATWNAWVMRGAAAALPGAPDSPAAHATSVAASSSSPTAMKRSATRRAPTCSASPSLRMRCASAQTGPPNSFKDGRRFEAVAAGTPPSPLPPLRVVMWVGDNIQDFPRLRQAIRSASDSAFAEFGDRFIVLPNPMYGSWERNTLP